MSDVFTRFFEKPRHISHAMSSPRTRHHCQDFLKRFEKNFREDMSGVHGKTENTEKGAVALFYLAEGPDYMHRHQCADEIKAID